MHVRLTWINLAWVVNVENGCLDSLAFASVFCHVVSRKQCKQSDQVTYWIA
jgi:hypothetical protein